MGAGALISHILFFRGTIMARKPRVQFPGALYHVIGRGNQQQDIFLEDADYSRYISYLSDYH
jgi:hypothetical protein